MACKIDLSLGNGIKMPALGFGTWQSTIEELENAMELALEAGYRHIDAAYVYENEVAIGNVIKRWLDSGRLKRSDLFIVTKLPPIGNRPEGVRKYFDRSLKALQCDYIDLYLIHTPFSFQEKDEQANPVDSETGEILLDLNTDHLAIWREMEKLVDEKLARSIGVSNFNIKQIERLLANSRIKPTNLQIEMHVYFQQRELIDFCRKHSIVVTAYSPLGSKGLVEMLRKAGIDKQVDILSNPTVVDISKKHQVSPAQIVLRHLIQKGVAAIPKSTNPGRLRTNIDVFEFTLDDDDVKRLNDLDKGSAGRVCDFTFFKGIQKHPEFPF